MKKEWKDEAMKLTWRECGGESGGSKRSKVNTERKEM